MTFGILSVRLAVGDQARKLFAQVAQLTDAGVGEVQLRGRELASSTAGTSRLKPQQTARVKPIA